MPLAWHPGTLESNTGLHVADLREISTRRSLASSEQHCALNALMSDLNRKQRLARFTDELLRIRVLRGTGESLASYVEAAAGGVMTHEEFESWCLNIETTVRIDLRKSTSAYQAVVFRLSAEDSEAHKLARSGSRYGFRQLARNLPGKTFRVRVEGGQETFNLREFLEWINKYDLNDLGACIGNWSEPQDGEPRVLILVALVPALDIK